MEKNLALKLFRVLRQSGTEEPLTDAQVRKLTGLDQMDIDIAAEQLEAEGMVVIERTYTLVED
jgi:predicted transcriptional regulator